MSEGECLICKSAPERVHQAVFSNPSWRASLSANQGYLGTLFIELLDHKETLSQLSAVEWSDFSTLVRTIEAAEVAAFSPAMFNWTCRMDNFYQSVPPKPHIFWHVRPRYDHEVKIDGKLMVDPNFGHHFDKDHFAHITPDLKKEIARRIQQHLSRPDSAQSSPLEPEPESPHPSASNPK